MKKYRIIFFGTPEFSVPFLEALIKSPFLDVVGVVTEPDRPKGRGKIMSESPVANFTNKILRHTPQNDNKINILKPNQISSYKLQVTSYKPDLIVVVAYGQIIPQEILGIPKYGAINVHPSDLPRYRGPAPIQGVLLAGEKETAISVMQMDAKMDHGPILDKLPVQIDENDDYFSLEKKITEKGPIFLVKILNKYLNIDIKPTQQDHEKATFTHMIKKEDGLIDWSKSPTEIHNQIRAYSAWPKAYTYIGTPLRCTKGKRLNILKSRISSGKLFLDMVQLEGKKPVKWDDFIRGYGKIIPKEILNKLNTNI